MKHLIIFLNYSHSRLENPVYRLFSTESLNRRNSTLLFLPKPLEERELLHEVSDLRRKQIQLSDITFHICCSLSDVRDAEAIINTARLIRRHFKPEDSHYYPIYAYALTPSLPIDDAQLNKVVWNNLVSLHNLSAEYPDNPLLNCVFLYQDQTQKSLAEYLFNTTRINIDFRFLHVEKANNPEWPPIFASFNSKGISYPEQAIRSYLHQYFMRTVIDKGLHETQNTTMETCIDLANHIVSNIPTANTRITLQEDGFLNISSETVTSWLPVETYWRENLETISKELKEVPHEEWLIKIKQKADIHYQTKFRNIGVDYFFQLQAKKTEEYALALLGIIDVAFRRIKLSHAYSPETFKKIVRAIINILQQKVIELQKYQDDNKQQLSNCEQHLATVAERWNSLNIFNRLLRKDTQILETYVKVLTQLQIYKTIIPGCNFAIKLLNELIPHVSALLDPCDKMQKHLEEVIVSLNQSVTDNNPSDQFSFFDIAPLEQTLRFIDNDTETMRQQYLKYVQSTLVNDDINNGDDLLSRVRLPLIEESDKYIDGYIANGSLPPVLNMPIDQRIEQQLSDKGGLNYYIAGLRENLPISLPVKHKKADCEVATATSQSDNGQIIDKYVLLTAGHPSHIHSDIECLQTQDNTHLQLLHLLYGISLTDLDGFSGQRMFVEPSIF